MNEKTSFFFHFFIVFSKFNKFTIFFFKEEIEALNELANPDGEDEITFESNLKKKINRKNTNLKRILQCFRKKRRRN